MYTMLKDVCRSCANNIKSEEKAAQLFTCGSRYLRKFQLLTGLEFLKHKDLPGRICERCQSEIDLAMKFRERVIFSQKYLTDMLEKIKLMQMDSTLTDTTQSTELVLDNAPTNPMVACESVKNSDVNVDSVANADFDDLQEEIELEVELEVAEAAKISNNYSDKIAESDFDLRNEYDTSSEPALECIPDYKEECFHFETNPIKRFICEHCAYISSDQSNFRVHMQRHGGQKRYNCEICDYKCHTTSELARHMVKHTRKRPHHCSFCGQGFGDRGSKMRHEKAHIVERPYPCLECGNTYVSPQELRVHIQRHGGDGKYECQPCDRKFSRKSHLIAHCASQTHKRILEKLESIISSNKYDFDEESCLQIHDS